MAKRGDTIEALGKTIINVDKPLRDKVKKLADNEGVTMVDYLRYLVDEAEKDTPEQPTEEREEEVKETVKQIREIVDILQLSKVRRYLTEKACVGYVKYNLLYQAKATLNALEIELNAKIEAEKAREASQQELSLG